LPSTIDLGTLERQMIEQVMRETRWNNVMAAKRLELSRTQLYGRPRNTIWRERPRGIVQRLAAAESAGYPPNFKLRHAADLRLVVEAATPAATSRSRPPRQPGWTRP
jgi:hypothetical protein